MLQSLLIGVRSNMSFRDKFFRISLCVMLVATTFCFAFQYQSANALQLTSRSLVLLNGATDGGSKPSGVVNHKFKFTIPSSTTLGSVRFQYCTTTQGACTPPTDMSASAATLDGTQVGGLNFTSVDTSTASSPFIIRTPATITASTAVEIQLNGVTNPSTLGTFFVRITTYSGNDGTTGATDAGVVAASTANQIVLTGTMPESLIFCAGATVAVDCSGSPVGAVSFNQLFSPSDTATATSQMAASTNANFGYVITVSGPTLTSGSNTIAAMTTAGAGIKGASQFGLNLKLNTTTTVAPFGTEVDPAYGTPAGHIYGGNPLAASGYDVADAFKFIPNGEAGANATVASSTIATDAQRYTISYIVNVPGSQAAGDYTTTLTYICTATF